MNIYLTGEARESKTITTPVRSRRHLISLLAIFSLLGSLLAACGAGGTGGATATPTVTRVKGNLQDLAADPSNAALLYLSLSYPMEVYRFSQSDGKWSSLTPKA
jgi:hypothetical protein